MLALPMRSYKIKFFYHTSTKAPTQTKFSQSMNMFYSFAVNFSWFAIKTSMTVVNGAHLIPLTSMKVLDFTLMST